MTTTDKKKRKKQHTRRKRRTLTQAERKRQLHFRIGLSAAGIFIVFLLFFAPFGPHLLSGSGKGRAVDLSDSVLQYQEQVLQYCEEYSIPAFSQIVLAIMQQESAGSVPDVMQASESPFNTWYANTPNSIRTRIILSVLEWKPLLIAWRKPAVQLQTRKNGSNWPFRLIITEIPMPPGHSPITAAILRTTPWNFPRT